MLKADNLSKSFGAQVLFEGISFSVNNKERVGLVGRNGHGKTTLIRLLTGEEQPDAGQIDIPKGYRLGYVRQHLAFQEETILAEGCRGLPRTQREETWRVEKILAGLGFAPGDMQRPPADFSGGYQVRLNLCQVLVSQPDLLLLDEPTNFLDVVAIRWLAGFLQQWAGELLLVTHDQSFMDRVITHTLGIHRQKVQKVPGTSEKYYQKLAQDETVYEKTRQNEEKKRKEVEVFINRFRAKARLANMVQSRVKTLEKQEPAQRLEKIPTLDFSFQYAPTPAKTLLQSRGVSFGYPGSRCLIDNLDLVVGKKDRIAVIGKNGSGKTTLLRLLAGDLPPDQGEITGHHLTRIGYYAQTNKVRLNPDLTVEAELMAAGCQRQKARDICGTMMFEGDQALKPIRVLSGGEKSRVLLGKLLAAPVNLLLLDEPTNHLDMDSCRAFLTAVNDFEGAVILVTHNEKFLYQLANRLLVFQSDGVRLFEGGYADFLAQIGWEDEALPSGESGRARSNGPQPGEAERSKKALRQQRARIVADRSRALSPLQEQIRRTETEIETLEAEAGELNTRMVTASEAGQGDRIADLSKRYRQIEEQVEALYEELARLSTELEEKQQVYDRQLTALE